MREIPGKSGRVVGNSVATYGARCALNKDILDLLNEKSLSGARSYRASV